ncbi:hypothetical protein Cgig2_011469 [Carnegiea gigantea]|uniref:Uncharacterized protein n=1 Tax=Carnegiea gigantea TaxID=171969 RepID=A0A9Q1KTY5_9CARY|nr:hypothetical protein Cgig2_011469 [Carnegiea gigantea]
MEELHLRGTKLQEIEECLKKIPLSQSTISAINSAYASGCDLRIVSDANTFFTETILKHHGMLHCFSEINTNQGFVIENGRLKILPYHDFKSSSHGCNLCLSNLCKLTPRDYIMPRKNFPLGDTIFSNPKHIKAGVHEWINGEELEKTLKNLINSPTLGDQNPNEFLWVGCKSKTGSVSASGSV